MAKYPFDAWYWSCADTKRTGKPCGEKNPKVVLQNILFDPVEYLECLRCHAKYDGTQAIEEGKVKWLWRCTCGFDVSWDDDFCHSPTCGQAWLLAGCPEKKNGGKPTVVKPVYHEPTAEELIEAWEKIWKGQKHQPIPGCPELCRLPHEFTLRLEAEQDVGCPRLPATVHALLEPAIDPKNPKGTLTWIVDEGMDLATFPSKQLLLQGDGTKTTALLVADTTEGETRFAGGTVGVKCTWNFGGPADAPQSASLRLPFHAGVTPGCPKACPEPTLGAVEVLLEAPDGTLGPPGDALCPDDRPLVLRLKLDPPVAGEATWTLQGDEVDHRGFEGAGLLGGRGPSLTVDVDEPVTLFPGRGAFTPTREAADVGLGPAGRLNGASYRLPPATLEVAVKGPGGALRTFALLGWHEVALEATCAWNGPLGTQKTAQGAVEAHAADDGVYVGLDEGLQRLSDGAVTGKGCAWTAQLDGLQARATDCAGGGDCLDRFGVGFIQAHAPHGRWAKYAAAEAAEGKEGWARAVAELPGARPLRDHLEGVAAPWYDEPLVATVAASPDGTIREPTADALDQAYSSDAPAAHFAWTVTRQGRTFELRRVEADDAFQAFLAAGRRDHAGAWEELCPLDSLRWRARLGVDVSPGVRGMLATGPVVASDVTVDPHVLRGRKRPEEVFQTELFFGEPTGPGPALTGVAVKELRLEHTRGASAPDEASFVFAPGHDTVRLKYTIDAPAGATLAGRLELRREEDWTPWALWSRPLTAAELAPGERDLPWDGSLEGGDFHQHFPGGLPTLDRSPYELRVVLPDVDGPGREAWTCFRLAAAGLRLEVGPQAMTADPSDLTELPPHGGSRTLYLRSTLFPTASGERYDDTQANQYRSLWGDGPEIPLLARVLLLGHEGDAVLAPRAVGRVQVLFDYAEDPLNATRSDGTVYDARARTVLEAVRGTLAGSTAPHGKNCHSLLGGKRGHPSARILPLRTGYAPQPTLRRGRFPFTTTAVAGRPWAVSSHTWPEGALAGAAGALFMPSRIAGDGYRLRAATGDLGSLSSAAEWPGATPQAERATHLVESGALRIGRRITTGHYLRKRDDVPELDWSHVVDDFEGAGLWLAAPTPRLVPAATWNATLQAVVAGLSALEPYLGHAVAPVDQHAEGTHGVYLRSYEEFKAAAEAAVGETLDPEVDRNFPSQPQYDGTSTITSWAGSYGDKVFRGVAGALLAAAPDGLNVIHTGYQSAKETDCGAAPAELHGVRRSRFAVLVYHHAPAGGRDTDADTMVHEGGHALFLTHAPGGSPPPEGATGWHHDPGQACWMSYHTVGVLCGHCLAGLSGMGPRLAVKAAAP